MATIESSSAAADGPYVRFFEEFDRLMLSDPQAALQWVDSAPDEYRNEDGWFISRAEALRGCRGPEDAATFLAGVVAEVPGFADAHYLLAELFEEMAAGDQANQHFLETLRLDRELDCVTEQASDDLKNRMAEVAGQTLSTLPPPFRDRLASVPVFLQPRPTEELVAAGVDPRALGLFEGPDLADLSGSSLNDGSTSITLFTHCLWDAFGQDEAELLEEVRVTVLHEVGHFFCLDEAQLAELGLE